ncbi:MAG: hypothetical protein VW868_06560, partial [Bacteroidota bacterium]
MTLFIILIALFSVFASEIIAQTSMPDSQRVTNIQYIELDRITVSASPTWKSETPGTASYLNAATLASFDYSNVHRVLSQVGGVYIQEEDGFG